MPATGLPCWSRSVRVTFPLEWSLPLPAVAVLGSPSTSTVWTSSWFMRGWPVAGRLRPSQRHHHRGGRTCRFFAAIQQPAAELEERVFDQAVGHARPRGRQQDQNDDGQGMVAGRALVGQGQPIEPELCHGLVQIEVVEIHPEGKA